MNYAIIAYSISNTIRIRTFLSFFYRLRYIGTGAATAVERVATTVIGVATALQLILFFFLAAFLHFKYVISFI